MSAAPRSAGNPPETERRVEGSLRSMTGFAQSVVQQDGFLLTISLRSVNHRFFDLRLHLPEMLLPLETALRRELKEWGPRGHLELKVSLEREAGKEPGINEAMLGKYVETFRALSARHGLREEPDLAALLQLPGVFSASSATSSRELLPPVEAAFRNALQETLERWDRMRAEEGRFLGSDLKTRAEQIGGVVKRLEQMRQQGLSQARQQFQERLQALLAEAGTDPVRLAQEAAVLAERTDVTEELLRMKAHIAQFLAALEGDREAGRKLDFLLQEMHREINTLLSKTAGLGSSGLPMTQLGLELKAEAEKLREQVQNLQ